MPLKPVHVFIKSAPESSTILLAVTISDFESKGVSIIILTILLVVIFLQPSIH